MNWEAIGAIFGIFAFVVTIFLEWPKLVTRFNSVSPLVVSSFFAYCFFALASLSLIFVFNPIVNQYMLYIGWASNVGSNVIFSIIAHYMMKNLLQDDSDKALAFYIYGLLMFVQIVIAFSLVKASA